MKTNISIILIVLFSITQVTAVDRIVAEGGQGGAFATITDAINAATSGDRILIHPKANGGNYSENLVIANKSLQLLSATEGVFWKLNGSVTFNPATIGQEFTISLCRNINGNITTGVVAPTGTRCKVNILGCQLDSGAILFAQNYYDCTIEGNVLLAGNISIQYGRIVGNSVTVGALCATAIAVNTDVVVNTDVLYVVGNEVYMSTSGCNSGGIYWTSTSQFFYIANNFIDSNSSLNLPIWINNTKTSTAGKNQVLNNTILHNGNVNNWGFFLNTHGSLTEVMNNTCQSTVGGYAFGSNVNSVNDVFQYNYTNLTTNTAFSTITNDGTNVTGAVFTMDSATGEITTGPQINGGSIDNAHLDLDMTRNNADCFGGSYSRSNFTNLPTGAAITFVIAPRRVLVGGTINISADGYDR